MFDDYLSLFSGAFLKEKIKLLLEDYFKSFHELPNISEVIFVSQHIHEKNILKYKDWNQLISALK